MPRHREEDGVFLILWALLLTALLTMVAIVIDLGHARETKRENQLVADFAALAAGTKLAGTMTGTGTFIADAVGACTDAFEYIKANTEDLPATASMSGASGCGVLPTSCQSASPVTSSVDAVATGADPYTITIRYPVPDVDIADAARPTPGTKDGTMCERMRVTVERENVSFFAGVLGVDSLDVRTSAVVRGFGTTTPENVPALALLERVGCGVLFTQSASPSSRLFIKAVTPAYPAIIQADSYGVPSQGGCDTTASGPASVTNKVVFGRATTTNLASIVTEDCKYTAPITATSTCAAAGPDTTEGQLALNAQRVGSPFGAFQIATTCPDPTCGIDSTLGPSEIVSRRVVDDKYLSVVQSLKTGSDLALNRANSVGGASRSDLISAGYKVYPTDYPGTACGALPAAATEITDDKVLVEASCDLNPAGTSLRFTGTKFIIAGDIDVVTGRTLEFPNAQEILVAGCSPTATDYGHAAGGGGGGGGNPCGNGPTTGQNNGINIAGNLLVNTRTAPSTTCPSSTSHLPARVVLRSGRFTTSTSSVVTLCQTFVYMSGVKPAASGISQSTSTTDHASCSTAKPCPRTTEDYGTASSNKYFGYTEVQGTVTWTAPNQSPTSPRNPSLPNQEFEDISLWTEGSVKSAIKGTGSTTTTGLFYLPNASFEFQGQSCTTPRDAQFFARRLELSGTSCFIMQPQPQNAIFTPRVSFSLIR